MPAYKDKLTGKWYVNFYAKDKRRNNKKYKKTENTKRQGSQQKKRPLNMNTNLRKLNMENQKYNINFWLLNI